MKCHDCAQLPRRAVTIGKPRNYLASAAASFFSAATMGALLVFFNIPFFGLVLPLLAGYAIGTLVRKISRGLGHGTMQAVTAFATAAGLTVGRSLMGMPFLLQIRGSLLLGTILAATAAAVTVAR